MPFFSFGCFNADVGDVATGVCDIPGASWFVGFIGLNNGDGTGSMDSWWADAN
jgi:hypothetical protein